MTDIPRRPSKPEVSAMDDLVKKLKEAPRDKVDQILTDDVQKFMKNNPYLPGKLKSHIKELTEACKKEGILKDVELRVDGQSGKAIVDDKATHKKFQINADTVVDKGVDKAAQGHEKLHGKYPVNEPQPNRNAIDKYPVNEAQPNRNAIDKPEVVPEKPKSESRKKDLRVPEPYIKKDGEEDPAEPYTF